MRRILFAAALLFASVSSEGQSTKADCLGCHENTALKRETGDEGSVQVDPAKLEASVHGPLECSNCHSGVTGYPHDEKARKVDCAACHPDSVEAWDHSLHARALKSGAAEGAKCRDCHGSPHYIVPSSDARSRTHRHTLAATCARCHAQQFVMEKAGLSAQSAISYQGSVHGRAVARGSTRAAVCTDCHDHHLLRPANDPQSGIFKFNVARTCGKCHAGIAAKYTASVHGRALGHGNWNAPVCTDCHGIHSIAAASDAKRGPRASCARCHEGVRLAEEFGVAATRVASYESSYHGLARRVGSTVAADCASCHGAHDVLPSSEPKSMIHAKNLTRTCGKCHPGAQVNFTRGKVHMVEGDVSDTPSTIVTWIRRIYVVLIAGTIGFMGLHNLLLWWRKARAARAARKCGKTVVRMSRNQRIQHAILFTSFGVLVVSGFALAWPDSFLTWFFGPSEQARRLVHRIAAAVMMALGVYHVGTIVLTKEGRQLFRDIWLRFSDGRELFMTLRYALGLSSEKPAFGRFSYAEKAEYWAGMWGTLVMAITGVMLWYSVKVTSLMPRWWIDVATTVHYYEAILATLAIIVWHFYHVIFDPDVYPMSFAWLDGHVPEHQFKEEHARAWAEANPQDGAAAKGDDA